MAFKNKKSAVQEGIKIMSIRAVAGREGVLARSRN